MAKKQSIPKDLPPDAPKDAAKDKPKDAPKKAAKDKPKAPPKDADEAEVSDPSCNLQCARISALQGRQPKHPVINEFVGPVKIVPFRPTPTYYLCKASFTAALTMSNVMLVANVLILYFFILAFKLDIEINMHVYLCTVGFHFLLYSGVFTMNKFYGPAIPLTVDDMWHDHTLCQMFGLFLGLVGSLSVWFGNHMTPTDFFKTSHAEYGLFVILCSIVSVMIGFATKSLSDNEYLLLIFKYIHTIIGTKVMVISSLCFVTGIKKPVFIAWLPLKEIELVMVLFCTVYTLVLVACIYLHLLFNFDCQ